MSKSLIIAEKPSVMNDLARVLGKSGQSFKKEKDFFENDQYVISSAVGHLVELKKPTTAEGKSLSWNWDHLPLLPKTFDLQPIEGNKARLNALKRLMKRKDVVEIINACDAGREGELIYRYIIELLGVDKPARRLWMQSMTDGAIIKAFEELRSEDEMQPLADAAMCRSESDWLVGLNSTRAMTAFNSKYGGFNMTPVGRVQTPTLALLTKREIEIRDFISRPYYIVEGEFSVDAGNYSGEWINESWKKDPNDKEKTNKRLWSKEEAEAVVERCRGKDATVEEERKPAKQAAPLLYDLTSLQREANSRFGFSAKRTLQLAQRLYETHKVATYPRTDSRALPEDYIPNIKKTLKTFSTAKAGVPGELAPHAAEALNKDWIKPNKKIFNDAKISDHHAIIPTGQIPKGLDEPEEKLFRMIAQRSVAVFFPPAEFENTTRKTRIGNDCFLSKGKILVKAGWLAVIGKKVGGSEEDSSSKKGEDKILAAVKDEEKAKADKITSIAKDTRPPARYNESTLLRAMETAGKLVKDEELSEAMSERGLGTPATRANIIEGLIRQKYINRDIENHRNFIASNRAIRLIEQLDRMDVEILHSPELTGEWEYKLMQMAQGNYEREKFMEEIKGLTKDVVDTAHKYAEEEINREYPRFAAKCPVCGANDLTQDEGRYKCDAPECKFTLPKVVASRPLSDDETKELLSKGELGKRDGYMSRFRQPFDASLQLVEDKKAGLKVTFVFEKSEAQLAEEAAVSEDSKLCPCPLCKDGFIHNTPTAYLCNNRANDKGCKARLSRVMCQYEIKEDQALKYFTEGKTDVIDEWISKKGRPFKAAILCKTTGNRMLGWEFVRAPKKKATATKAAKKKVSKKKTAQSKKSKESKKAKEATETADS